MAKSMVKLLAKTFADSDWPTIGLLEDIFPLFFWHLCAL